MNDPISSVIADERARALAAFKKDAQTLRHWMQGAGWHMALRAMELGASYHKGYRKDGFTPEFHHQVQIALFVKCLPDLLMPEETVATAFTHDLCEDFDLDPDDLRSQFGQAVGNATWAMTKTWRGIKRSEDELFALMADDPIASIAKPADRDHNMRTMRGVFSSEKRLSYSDFAEHRILPLIKHAKRRFTQQEPAYEILKYLITQRISYERELGSLQQQPRICA